MRMVVVFPEPEGPTTPTMAPVGTSRSSPETATKSSNRRVRPSARIAGSLMAHLLRRGDASRATVPAARLQGLRPWRVGGDEHVATYTRGRGSGIEARRAGDARGVGLPRRSRADGDGGGAAVHRGRPGRLDPPP